MQASNVPVKFNVPFASSAGGSFINTPIPVTSGTPDAASLSSGFPPACFGAGGAPLGQDFNGLFFQVTGWNQWQQAGGPITYDGTFQTAISGYPKSAIVQSATTDGKFWISTVDNNTTNPDTGGAGWQVIYATSAFTSSAQTIASQTYAAHGLGARPARYSAQLVCVTPEQGYSAGDTVNLPATTYTQQGGGVASDVAVWADATNVGVSFSSTTLIYIALKGGGSISSPITPANWTIVLRAALNY